MNNATHTPGPTCTCGVITTVIETGIGCYDENEIAQCPLCKSAPAMYEALLSILPATDIVSGQETDNCRWCGRDYTDHAVETGETLELCSSDDCPGYIARAALAQAEGRG